MLLSMAQDIPVDALMLVIATEEAACAPGAYRNTWLSIQILNECYVQAGCPKDPSLW